MNKERLLKLADHLENGKLLHNKFDFRYLNGRMFEFANLTSINPCGSCGCALGELPAIFKEWEFSRKDNFRPRLINANDIARRIKRFLSFDDAEIFFDISPTECVILFNPYDDYEYFDENSNITPAKRGILQMKIHGEIFQSISPDSTKEDVANHIREFVRLKELETK
jgi:hypothetical protein